METRNKLEQLRKNIRSGKVAYEEGVKQLSEKDKKYTKNVGIFMLVSGILVLIYEISSFMSGESISKLFAIAPAVFLPMGYILFRTRNYALMGKKGFYTTIAVFGGIVGTVMSIVNLLFGYYSPLLLYTSIFFLITGFILGRIRKIKFNKFLNDRI
jgi:hypothetical protein